MDNGVGRSAQRVERADGVFKSGKGHDLAGTQILLDAVHDEAAGRGGQLAAAGIRSRYGSVSGGGHAKCFAEGGHRRSGSDGHAVARTADHATLQFQPIIFGNVARPQFDMIAAAIGART